MTASEARAAQQEADMLRALNIDESAAARRKAEAATGAAQGENPRAKFIRGHEAQRRTLKASGMDEYEIDCFIAEQIGEPVPPMPPGRTNAPLVEVGSMAEGTAGQVAEPPPSQMTSVVPAMKAAFTLPEVAFPAVEPIEMTDEEMREASSRVRTAKAAVASTEALLAEAGDNLAAAREELAEAQRLLAAGAAWLTQ